MSQPRGPGTACRLVSRRHHLCPRSGASSRHYFILEAIPTASTADDKPFSSCAANSVFSFDVVRCPCSHFDITPPKSALWWMNVWIMHYGIARNQRGERLARSRAAFKLQCIAITTFSSFRLYFFEDFWIYDFVCSVKGAFDRRFGHPKISACPLPPCAWEIAVATFRIVSSRCVWAPVISVLHRSV